MQNLPVIRTRNCIKFINEKYSNRITHQVSFIPLTPSGQIEFFDEVEKCETDQGCKMDCENCDYCEIANCDCEEIAISQTRQSGF